MIFDWSDFTAEDWVDYCAKVENDQMYADDFIGAVRVGELCFDFVTREYDAGKLVLTFDLYVGGIDSGYGYSRIEDGYPYDYAEGSNFDDTCISLPYQEFQLLAEAAMKRYLGEGQIFYAQANLTELAERPLHIW